MKLVNYIIPLCNIGDNDFNDRLLNVNFLIKHFLSKQLQVQVHLILVEQIIKKDIPSFLPLIKTNNIDCTKITVEYPIFVKPWLYNIGVKHAKSEHLIIGESDVFSPNPLLFYNLLESVNNVSWCFIWDKVVKLTKESKEKLFLNNEIDINGASILSPKKNCCEGMGVYFNINFWNLLGGANELFKELGANDNELAYRASIYSNTYIKFPATIYHLWHTKSKMKPDTGVANSVEYNRELRVYVIARPEEFTNFLRAQGTGKEVPIEAGVSNVISIYPELKVVAQSCRKSGQCCYISKQVYNNLLPKDRDRIFSILTLKFNKIIYRIIKV